MKLLIVVYLLACGWFADAQTAIRAKVLDRETREVLIGVNIFFIKDKNKIKRQQDFPGLSNCDIFIT